MATAQSSQRPLEHPTSGGPVGPPEPEPPFQPAYYVIRLDALKIENTRARHEDTVHVAFGLRVGDEFFETQFKHMGELNNGTYPIDLQFGPILINTDSVRVAFNYLIANTIDSIAQVEEDLRDASKVLLVNAPNTLLWPDILSRLDELGQYRWSRQLANWPGTCDGPVAFFHVGLPGSQLWKETHGTKPSHSWMAFRGVWALDVCGGASEYYVTISIIGSGLA